MKLIIYTRHCLACRYKSAWKNIKKFARENKLSIEERRIRQNEDWSQESAQWDIDPPFITLGRNAVQINGELERLL